MKPIFLLLIFFIFLACGQATTKTKDARPNILFIMSDDHAYQAISAYDSKLIQTPNIDRIAKEGMLFTNASVTNSICAPSRAVILTGKHSHINGKIDNNMPFDTTQVTFPQIFQKNGYQTAMFGKLHFGNSPKGVDEFMILPGQGNYYNPKFITGHGDTTITGYVTDIITDLTIEWLEKKRDSSKPFMLMYLHKAPHRNWWNKADVWAKYIEKEFPYPETLFDNYGGRKAASTAEMNLLKDMSYRHDTKISSETLVEMGNVTPEGIVYPNAFKGMYDRLTKEQQQELDPVLQKINQGFKETWPTLSDEEKMKYRYQRYMQDYLATIETVDENVGRVLDYLEESGLEENTVVVYTSDQGFYLGEHGWYDKRFIYDESFKTPLLIKWPNKIKPGSTQDEMVQNLDFAQTFLDIAGIQAPEDMQGESILPLLLGNEHQWTRDALYYHYYEYPGVHAVKRHYGIVTRDYKLVHFYYDIDEWELYDRKSDPKELNNVYDDPEYKEVVSQLTKDLNDLREKYKDSEELDQKFIELTGKKN